MTMKIESMIEHLRTKAEAVAALSFEEIVDQFSEPEILDCEEPRDGTREQFQLETEILDRFDERGCAVLHVPVSLHHESRTISTELFVYKDGRVRWNRGAHEYREGVPIPIGSLDRAGR
jgi:hypothetical protein